MTEIPLNSASASDLAAVREQLDRIRKSGPFQQSLRRQRFLEYLVTEAMAGRGDRLKGYNIALEVFDRPSTFDPNIDPLIRIEAGRLRDKLREYYAAGGQDDPIRIGLPKGSYEPVIEFRRATGPSPTAEAEATQAPLANLVPARAALMGERSFWTGLWWTASQKWRLALPAAALLLALMAAGAWLVLDPEVPAPEASVDKTGSRASEIPAIAVLPFLNLSGDEKQDYFSDGVTEDILTELSRSRDLRVLARNTSFQYKDRAVDIPKLGRDLGVDYVLEGSVRRADGRLRVTAQLIDAETGTHVWADRFEREMADVFLVQDEIVSQIAAKVAGGYGAIESSEAKSAARKSAQEIEAYDLVLRARGVMTAWDWTSENFRTARNMLRQAIALDPSSARARRELAWFALLGWIFRLDETPVPAAEITEQASKAVQLDGADARARMVAASAYFFTKQLGLFAHEADQALVLAPYDAEITATLGCMISSAGDHERGVALAKKANALNADAAIGWYHSTVYTAYYLAGDYERALEVARQNKQTEMFYAYIEIIPIYGQLGRSQDAQDAWKKLREQVPDASAETFENWWRLWNIRDGEVAKLMDGVYKSGVLSAETKPGQ